MKKGLLLALMMVAMVALTVPAGAVAPTIGELPTVIIGDAEDATGASPALHLMRYLNAFNIASKITRDNGYTLDKLHVYYIDDGSGNAKFSTEDRIVDPLTAGEASALTGSGTLPANGKQVTSSDGAALASDFYWASLINDAINQAATTPATDAYSATAAANGVLQADYPAGSTGEANVAALTLYAVDGDDDPTTPNLVADGDMLVYSLVDANDNYSPAETLLYSADAAALAANWYPHPGNGGRSSTDADGLVITAGTTNSTKEVTIWLSGDAGAYAPVVGPVTEASTAGSIFKMRCSLTGDPSSADLVPSYRLVAQSERYHHMAGTIFRSNMNGSAPGEDLDNLPYTGNDVDILLYWAAPMDLTQMADDEIMADPSSLDPGAGDAREYALEYRVIDRNAAEGGVFHLGQVDVWSAPRPADTTPLHDWSADGTAFDDTNKPWYPTYDVPGGFPDGVFTIDASGDFLTIGAGNDSSGDGRIIAAPYHNEDGRTAVVADQLDRIVLVASSANTLATPNIRLMAQGMKFNTDITGEMYLGNQTNGMFIGNIGLEAVGSLKALMNQSDGDPPCVPKSAGDGGSVVELYYHTNLGAGASDPTVFVPELMVKMRSNRYGGPDYTGSSDYPRENGNVVIDQVIVEQDV